MNCNNELLEQQKIELKHEIVHGSNKDFFRIFDIEAGCRKTRTAEVAISDLITTTDKNVIFVRMNNQDCRESVQNINAIVGEDVAFAYNNEDVPNQNRISLIKRLPSIRVLLITHAKYLVLATDKNMRKKFTENRQVLIIDEFISDIKKLSINQLDIDTYKRVLKTDIVIYKKFLNITSKIEDYIKSFPSGKNFVRLEISYPTREFNGLVKYIKCNITADKLQEKVKSLNEESNLNQELLNQLTTVKQLCEHMETIKEFYQQVCVFDNGTLYTSDSRIKYWLLDNNILLDASGELQIAYSINKDLYHLENCEPVLDHSKWKLINIEVNSTTAGKERINNFYDVVNKTIAKYGDDILVIGSKSELPFIQAANKAYFGNITGSNTWADCSNVAIIQTHNLNDIDYVLKFLHYSKEYIDKKIVITSKNTGRQLTSRYSFSDDRFEKIRILWITSETYQAIKRVNRNMIYSTEALIFMNNSDVMELLQKKLKGCAFETVDLSTDFQYEYTKQDRYIDTLQKNSYANRFITLMAELQNGLHPELVHKDKNGNPIKGTYRKSVLRDYIGIKSSANFNHQVLTKTEVVTFCEIREISTDGQYVKLACAE